MSATQAATAAAVEHLPAAMKKGVFGFHPLTAFAPSTTNPRKTFDDAKLAELAKSVATHDVLEPILARPHPLGGKAPALVKFEIVAGERRWRASQLAKRQEISAIVREMTDKQALEIQTIENAQREDLHPLEQAAGYDRLIKEFGYTPETIADAIGKSRAHVFQIRKLRHLSEPLRQRFIAGELDTTLATVFARVPGEALQARAWLDLKREYANGFSFRVAADFVRKNFMLDLTRAKFDIKDATLNKRAGACGECPHRTGNQVDLFPDVKNGNVCTDPGCFAEKLAAHGARQVKTLEKKGTTVITGKAAKSILPYDHSELYQGRGYAKPSEKSYDDAKRRPWSKLAELAGVDQVKIQDPHSHNLISAVPVEKVKKALAAKGIKLSADSSNTRSREASNAREKANATRAQLETEARRLTWLAIRSKITKLDNKDLAQIAAQYFAEVWNENTKRVLDVWKWPHGSSDGAIAGRIAKLNGPELARFLVDLAVTPEIPVNRYQIGSADGRAFLTSFGRRHGVQLERIRTTVFQAHKQKQAAAAALKKARARKASSKVKTIKTKGKKKSC